MKITRIHLACPFREGSWANYFICIFIETKPLVEDKSFLIYFCFIGVPPGIHDLTSAMHVTIQKEVGEQCMQ